MLCCLIWPGRDARCRGPGGERRPAYGDRHKRSSGEVTQFGPEEFDVELSLLCSGEKCQEQLNRCVLSGPNVDLMFDNADGLAKQRRAGSACCQLNSVAADAPPGERFDRLGVVGSRKLSDHGLER